MVKIKCEFCGKKFKKPKLPDNVIQFTKDICSDCWTKEGEKLVEIKGIEGGGNSDEDIHR